MSAVSAGWKSWDDVPVVLVRREVMELIGVRSRSTFEKLVDFFERSEKPVAGAYKYTRASVKRYCRTNKFDPFK